MTTKIAKWATVLMCRDCHKRPVDKPDEAFHWELGRLDTCICTTCLNIWFVEVAIGYQLTRILEGEDLFKR